MFFILSKVLVVFIFPLTWVFGLIVYAVFTKRPKRKQGFIIAAMAVLYFFSNRFTADAIARIWDVPPYQPSAKTYSCVVLLGGFISRETSGQGYYFNAAADRYTQATKLLANHTASHLLFTGGDADIYPSGFVEADFVKVELKKKNFADSLILLDGKARNTAENALFAKQLLKQANLKPPYLLVTSAFHMRRAMLIFKKNGVNVVPHTSNNMEPIRHIYLKDFLPDVDALTQWNIYIKEMVGYIVACLN
jgi:uncharacterized SAM-binding protein YcdF (DUF218 family)